jgi:hypothetical protein
VAQRARTEGCPVRDARLARTGRGLLARSATTAVLLLTLHAHAQQESGTTASTSLYVRTDSDHTTVVTPRVRVGTEVADQTRVDLVYTADIWTSASIDIRTSASKAVTEQRDELDASIEHAFQDFTLGGSYRYSNEIDYESHGGALGGTYDFANKSASLSITARASFDQVGRAGDPGFWRAASTLSVRTSFTQVLDPKTLVQLVYEPMRQQGYLSSPYRYVRIATDVGQVPSTCVYPVKMCMLENNPGTRLRHAIAVNGRRALSGAISVGASYRFYLDDWDVMSHTASVDGAWLPGGGWLLSLGYRFYHQSAASHYRAFYPPMPVPAHYTSDKELTSLSYHRIELQVSHTWRLDEPGSTLRTLLLAGPSYFSYADFLPLDHIAALDLTLALEVKL